MTILPRITKGATAARGPRAGAAIRITHIGLTLATFFSPALVTAATTAEQAGAGLHGTLAVRGPNREHGDWASHVTGLYSPHRLYIEVPPGTANLVIELFDAENGTTHEFSGTADPTEVHHRLFDPSGAEIGPYSTRVSSLTRTGTTATAVVPGHGLTTGNTIKILGAIQAAYDVTATATVIDANTFTYTVAGSPATPATGFIELLPRRATVTGITRAGGTATVTTSAAHGLLVGQETVIFGATQTGYNGRAAVLSTPSATTFTYTVSGTPTTPATGSIALATPRATALTALSRTGGTATATTAAAHGLNAGQAVRILNASVAAYNDTFNIVSVPTATTFTFALAGGPDSSTGTPVVQYGMPVFIAGTPGGAATTGDNGTLNVPNDAWRVVYRIPNPTAGHWEYRIDARTEIQADTGSDDNVNGFGIRVHDGDTTSGGTELNVYYDGMATHTATAGQQKLFTFYPYITTAGPTTTPATNCGMIENAFDEDDGTNDYRIYTRTSTFPARPATPPTYGPGVLPAPSGSLTVNGPSLATRSANDTWHSTHRVLTGFDSDILQDDLGIWMHRWAQNGQNLQTIYYGNSDSLPIAPTTYGTIPAAGEGKFRIYLPSDGLGAPLKPYVVMYLGGGLTVNLGTPDWVSVNVRVVNPTPFPITFDSTRRVLIPWAPDSVDAIVAHDRIASVSQGSASYNAGLKRTEWNIGTLAANTSAEIEVVALVTPLTGVTIPVTDDVTATWLDETANASQTRATYTFGPMCEMYTQVGQILDADVAQFRAAAAGVGAPVIIDWTTVAELDNAGFHLYRAVTNPDSSVSRGERLTPVLVPAQGAASVGASYQFVDTTPIASATEVRGYYLFDIDLAGNETQHGPVFATIGGTASKVDGWEKF